MTPDETDDDAPLDPRLGPVPPNWEWIEAETLPPGHWFDLAMLGNHVDSEDLPLDELHRLIRAGLADAVQRAFLDHETKEPE